MTVDAAAGSPRGRSQDAREIETIIGAIGEGIIVVDRDGLVGHANRTAQRMLGPLEEVDVDGLLARFVRPEDVRRKLLRGPVEARLATGAQRWLEVASYPVEEKGEAGTGFAMILVLRDVTVARDTERAREAFIGMLSHELRTPVTAIYGGSQILLARGDRLDREITRDLITDIAAEAERLHRLIENLLVLARVERGEDLVGGEPVLLQHVLPSIVDRERSLWLGTEIEVKVQPGLPTVRGHDGYVAQVIRNLLSNATKYGGPEANVEIVAEGGKDGVIVRVLDDGPGIDADTADRLFDLYYRAPAAAMKATGAGIGLFVCRRIVDALGGTIWARERPSGGAEFGFSLPIYAADEDMPVPVQGGELAAAS
jgi:signal transduction histidine kinase